MRWVNGGVSACVLTILLAGCSGGGGGEASLPEPTDGLVDGDPLNLTLPALSAPPLAWHVGTAQDLTEVAPVGTQPTEYDIPLFAQAAAVPSFPVFPTAAPRPDDLVIESANMTFHFRHDGVGQSLSALIALPEVGLLLGSDGTYWNLAFLDGPDTVQPGTEFTISAGIPLPKGGQAFPAGTVPEISVGSLYASADAAGTLKLLTAAVETDSVIELDAYSAAFTPSQPVEVLRESVELFAGGCGALGRQEGVSSRSFEVNVTADSLGLWADVVPEQSGDIDLYLYDSEGERVASANTPAAAEQMRLYENNVRAIGAGTWRLEVVNCIDGPSTFDILVQQLNPAAGAPPA